MRPWTTRTLQAAVVAAGFAAVGTGTASAADTPAAPMPDLTQVPDQIGFQTPLDFCQTPPGVEHGRDKAPCADLNLKASSPNLFKKVGADIARTSYGLAGELQDGQPLLAPGKPNNMLGHVFAETTSLAHMTKTRPTVGAKVEPKYTGVLDDHSPQGGLLDTEVGPREPGHEGLSAADTAADLTAAEGFRMEPLANPVGMVAPMLHDNPLQTSGSPLTLPKAEQVLPAIKQVQPPKDNGLAGAAKQVLHNAATSAPQAPASSEQLPVVKTLTGSLS